MTASARMEDTCRLPLFGVVGWGWFQQHAGSQGKSQNIYMVYFADASVGPSIGESFTTAGGKKLDTQAASKSHVAASFQDCKPFRKTSCQGSNRGNYGANKLREGEEREQDQRAQGFTTSCPHHQGYGGKLSCLS
jgi:hypothetical protein